MKNKITYILSCLLVTFGLFSCDDLLDKEPLTEVSDSDVWSDPALVEAFVNARYSRVGHGWNESMWSSVVDESHLTWPRGGEPITQGTVNPSNLGTMNHNTYGENYREWNNIWLNISNCNWFLERIDEVPFKDDAKKTRLTGEVRFIRALLYHDLVDRWGGMPLLTHHFSLDDREEIIQMKRATYKDCVNFMLKELDRAAAELPDSYSGKDKGRATRIAALALKSRILLYAASDLMNIDVKSELIGYKLSDSDPDRWRKAAEAAETCIEEALKSGYALFDDYGEDVKTKYIQLFLQGGNCEIIFDRESTSTSGGYGIMELDKQDGPNGYASWGGNTPISELADDFEMDDGTPFSWDSWEKYGNDPWKRRDKRFYATILCDGDWWKYREVETFIEVDAQGKELTGGLDSKFGQDTWNTSKSGYNLRKFIDENYADGSQDYSYRNWIWLRLGEQYLNLAEARCMEGKEAEAKAAVNEIRQRARMPYITTSGKALLESIRHERRIELCFEEHRYYDVRRWKLGEEILNYNATGVVVYKWPDEHKTYHPGQLVEKRKFFENMYWLPIPKEEIDKSPNLEQNPGYN